MPARYLARVVALLSVFYAAADAATFTWDGDATLGSEWMRDSNWAGDVAPPSDGTADLVFAGTNRLDPAADPGGWSIRSLSFASGAGPFQINGSELTIGAGGVTQNDGTNDQVISNNVVLGTSQTWSSPGTAELIFRGSVHLNGSTLTLTPGSPIDLSGSIGGSGSITVEGGTGAVEMTGSGSNTYAGAVTVNSGTLRLGKTANVTAITAALIIGDGVGSDSLVLDASEQIANGADLILNSSGQLSFQTTGRTENMNLLTLNGGTIEINSGSSLKFNGVTTTGGTVSGSADGTLVLRGWLTAPSGSTAISGPKVDLDANAREFNVSGNLSISGVIANGGLIKTGAGTLLMDGPLSNMYTGSTVVRGGTLELAKSSGPAVRGALQIDSAGTVRLKASGQLSSASLTINGGLLDLDSFDYSFYTLGLNGGSITGSGKIAPVDGIYVNTPASSASTISAQLDLANNARTINVADQTGLDVELSLSGEIIDGNNPFAVGKLTKYGAGTMLLSADSSTWSGGLTIAAGEVALGHNAAAGTGTLAFVGGKLRGHGAARTVANPLRLGGDFEIRGATDLTFTGGATLTGNRTLRVNNSGLTILSGSIGEDVAGRRLYKDGSGVLRFSGSAPNVYTGGTTVSFGRLELAKPAGVNAVNGPLAVGYVNSTVRHLASDQINGQDVDVSLGFLDLNGFSDSIGNLSTAQGTITTGAGTLRIGGDISASQTLSGISVVNGNLDLLGGTRTLRVANDVLQTTSTDFIINAAISNGGLLKTGAGMVRLNGANTFAGGLTLGQGDLFVGHDAAAGSGLLTFMEGVGLRTNTARTLPNALAFDGNFTIAGSGDLMLAGAATLTGDRTINITSTGTTTLAGTIGQDSAARSLIKAGPGTLRLGGAASNTYSGATTVNSGVLVLAKTGANVDSIAGSSLVIGDAVGGVESDVVRLENGHDIADTVAVTVSSSGLLDLNGHAEVVGPLVLGGSLKLGQAALQVAGDYVQTSTGALKIAITGPASQPTSSSRVLVQGRASLAGAVNIAMNNTFGARVGDRWPFVTGYGAAPARSGTFSHVNVDATNLPNGTALAVRYVEDGAEVELVGVNYDAWAGGVPFASGADALPEADPDGDGVRNQIEYALGMNPLASDTQRLPTVSVTTVGAERFLTLTYQRFAPPALPTDLTYAVERSNDVANAAGWSSSGVTESVTTNTETGLQTVIARSTTPMGTAGVPREFLRLRVTRQ